MATVLSGLKPTGPVTLGNYLGALRIWVDEQRQERSYFLVVDLHALTVAFEPNRLRALITEAALCMMAAGLDPEQCTLFVQSDVVEHTELAWLLECTASFGELSRMTQFKDKSSEQEFVSSGLFTYPVLMAADILLYDVDQVPVGEDQRQHVELTRNLAVRFNNRYGEVLTVPEATVPKVAARVKDLQDPTRKMSASAASVAGTILLLDPPEVIQRKVKRAVTDTETEVRYDPVAKPGVSNLLTILAAATGAEPEAVAEGFSRYGDLKQATADALVAMLEPIQARYHDLAGDRATVDATLARGAEKARGVAALTLSRARDAVGLLPRH